jgi:hypothetical protein
VIQGEPDGSTSRQEVGDPGVAKEQQCGIYKHVTPSKPLQRFINDPEVSNRSLLTLISTFLVAVGSAARFLPPDVETQI